MKLKDFIRVINQYISLGIYSSDDKNIFKELSNKPIMNKDLITRSRIYHGYMADVPIASINHSTCMGIIIYLVDTLDEIKRGITNGK